MSLFEVDVQLAYPSGFRLAASFTSDARRTALFGRSGSGKSTLLSVIAGLRRPDAGRVRIADRVLFDHAARVDLAPEQRAVGYVFQQQLLFPHLNVRDNLLYGWQRTFAAERGVEPPRVIEMLDLGALMERKPGTLSGGQRQRVALGRALLRSPRLLLLDEPLVSLDESLKEQVIPFIERVLEEWRVPMLYVTHDRGEAERLCTATVELEAGEVVGT